LFDQNCQSFVQKKYSRLNITAEVANVADFLEKQGLFATCVRIKTVFGPGKLRTGTIVGG
jgi:hypothetical protein